MRNTYLIIAMVLMCSSLTLHSQQSLDSLVLAVKENNKTLKTAKANNTVEILESKTGILPENPEVEFGYLIGSPSSLGNRTDFSISQSFDFPSSYIHKKKAARHLRNQSTIQTKVIEQEIIEKTKKAWIDQVYLNRLQKLIANRLSDAEKLQVQYQRKFALGEINQLEVNKAKLYTSLLRNEYDKAELALHKNNYLVAELTGGGDFIINDSIFPQTSLFLPDSITNESTQSPEIQFFEEQLKIAEVQTAITKSEKLPKIMLGYYSERLGNEFFKGFKLGFSIPLWENKNQLKKAKSEVLVAQTELDEFTTRQTSQVQQLLERKEHIQKQVKELSGSLSGINDEELLLKALNAGEISLNEYHYQSEFIFRSRVQLLEMQKEELHIEIELMRILNMGME